MYFILALIVAFGTVLVLPALGAFIGNDSEAKKRLGWNVACAIIYTGILWLVYWMNAIAVVGPVPLFFSIFIGCGLGAIVNQKLAGMIGGIIVIIGYMIVYMMIVVGIFQGSDWARCDEKADLIGTVDETDFEIISDLSQIIEPTDPAYICQVPPSLAWTLAQNAFSEFHVEEGVVPGSRYVIGDETKCWVDGQLWHIFPVEFDGWLKWRKGTYVPGYLRVSAQNPFLEGQAVQRNKQGEEIKIQYLNSACWQYKAVRHLRNDGFLYTILDDWTFEPDDNWNPYYTVSALRRVYGFSANVTKGVIVLDLQTGKWKFHEVDKVPSWSDRVIPLGVIDYNLTKWGLYDKSTWWNTLIRGDRSQMPTPGWYLTYSPTGKCQWFTGWTSKSSKDQALLGFSVTDARTMKTTYVKAKGATEQIAYNAAMNLWSEIKEGLSAEELVPYNIAGQMTYVIPMIYNNQFKGISLVNLRNQSIKAKGNNLDEALANYRLVLSSARSDGTVPSAGDAGIFTLTGRILEVGLPVVRGESQYFTFRLEGISKVFEAGYRLNEPEAAFLKAGREVTVTYLDSKMKTITCESLDITEIVLSDENPAQARYKQSRVATDQEVERVHNGVTQERLLKSDVLKQVDPDSLKQFLLEQQKHKKD